MDIGRAIYVYAIGFWSQEYEKWKIGNGLSDECCSQTGKILHLITGEDTILEEAHESRKSCKTSFGKSPYPIREHLWGQSPLGA